MDLTAVKESGGDYSVFFWVKATGSNSLNSKSHFLPGIKFISNYFPTNVNLASFGEEEKNGQTRYVFEFHSACGTHVVCLSADH